MGEQPLAIHLAKVIVVVAVVVEPRGAGYQPIGAGLCRVVADEFDPAGRQMVADKAGRAAAWLGNDRGAGHPGPDRLASDDRIIELEYTVLGKAAGIGL